MPRVSSYPPKVGEEGPKEPLRLQQCHPEAPVYLHDMVSKLPTARPVPRISHPGLRAPLYPPAAPPVAQIIRK